MLPSPGVCGGWRLACTAPVVLPRAFGPQFKESVVLLILLLPGCAAFATTNILAGYFNGVGKPKLNLTASAAGLVLTAILDVALIPHYGARGGAVAAGAPSSRCTG